MKIAFVVHDYNYSWGHSRYVAELAERFSAEHEVHVFANTIAANRSAAKIHFHRVPACRQNAFLTILTFILPATLQSAGRYDIIHSQGLCSLRFDVTTAHQCNAQWYKSRRQKEGRLSWREHLFGTAISWLEKRMYSQMQRSRVIAVSNRMKRDLRESYRCVVPIDVIHHGVDGALFSIPSQTTMEATRRAWGVERDRFVFLYAGDLRKGAQACIRAMRQFPEGSLVLVSRSQDKAWRNMAEEAGVADRVVFAGPSEAIQDAYAAADAFLMPTPYDPFGLVITEAMSSGLPVIASGEAGASELIVDGENGLILADVGSEEELVGHMRHLFNDREFAQELGRRARRTAADRSWNKVAEETMQAYCECLRDKQKGASDKAVRPSQV